MGFWDAVLGGVAAGTGILIVELYIKPLFKKAKRKSIKKYLKSIIKKIKKFYNTL